MGFFSCFSSKSTAYFYGTSEFRNKVEGFDISIDQAAEICAKYIFEQNEDIDETFTSLQVVYKDYYIFSDFMFSPKSGRYNLSGIWINGNTGEIKEVSTKKVVTFRVDITKNVKYIKKKTRENVM